MVPLMTDTEEDQKAQTFNPGDRVVIVHHDQLDGRWPRAVVISPEIRDHAFGYVVEYEPEFGTGRVWKRDHYLSRLTNSDLTIDEIEAELREISNVVDFGEAQHNAPALKALRLAEELLRRLQTRGVGSDRGER